MKTPPALDRIEILEARIAPATLDVVGGVLTYTAGAGAGNSLTLSISGANYVFTDTGETITLGAGAVGFSGGGTNTVQGPNTSVNSIVALLGDQNDTLTISGLTDPLNADGQTGAADSIVIGGVINPGGVLSLDAESLTINAALNSATTATFTADTMAINAAVIANSLVLQPATAARAVNLGTESAGDLSLTGAELNRITAVVGLQVGNAAAGVVTLSAALAPTGVNTLSIFGSVVTNIGAGAISVANLGLSVVATAALGGANDVDVFAAATSNADQLISFTDADGFAVGTVGTIVGITVPTGGVASLEAGAVTQTSKINAATLRLIGAGPYTLTNPGNTVGTLSANVTGGAFSYTDADALTVGLAGGTGGVTTANFPIALATVDGVLTIANSNAGADVNAGTSSVSLTAGSVVGVDRALTISANAGVSGTGGVTLVADNMSIGAAVNAGAGIATLRGFDNATTIFLDSSDGAGRLGLTDAEIDFVTASVLRIGKLTGGSITFGAVLTPANVGAVSFFSAGNINTSAGGITGVNVAADAGGIVSLQNSTIPVLAVHSGGITFIDTTGTLTIGTVDGRTGMDVAGGASIVSDDIDIQAAVASPGDTVSFSTRNGADLNLGSGAAGYRLTDTELDLVTASFLNFATNGAVLLNSAISPAHAPAVQFTGATISGAGAITVADLFLNAQTSIALGGANDVDTLHATLATDGGTISFADADGFTAFIGEDEVNTATLNAGVATVTFGALNQHITATGSNQITVLGAVDLAGVTLNADIAITPAPGTEFILIANDGVDPVTGAFDQLPEGALTVIDGVELQVRYTGGDGNDVTLTAPAALAVTLAGKSATYRDVDGDLVTVKTSVGTFTGAEFFGIETGANGAGQLRTLKLGAGFTGANLTFTAKPTAQGGNGFVNLGFLDAIGVDLGAVTIPGDLALITAGTVGGDVKVPGVKSLTVQSMGLLGVSTQGPGGSLESVIQGALPRLEVKGDLRASLAALGLPDGKIGGAKIGGSLVSTGGPLQLFAAAGIGSLKIGGDIRTAGETIRIDSGAAIGAISVGGAIAGEDTAPVFITAFGQLVAPAKGTDLAINSLAVKGSVSFAILTAGTGSPDVNADASIGAITIGGDWIASNATAGAAPGTDGLTGNNDDVKITIGGGSVRDNAAIFSSIGSFTVKGQAFGTATPTNDMFGVVAERIGKAKVGGRTFAFTSGAAPEAFFAAPTLTGGGAENPAFDFTIRELGSATPVPTIAVQFDISGDGRSATFVDLDGDHVTLTTSAGSFQNAVFGFANEPAGGKQLKSLTLDAGFAGANLTITAKPGPDGGNGFVNLGQLTAPNADLGTVRIAGDVGRIDAGTGDPARPGVKALTVHSIGALGTSTGAVGNSTFFKGGIGTLTVGSDVRGVEIFATGGPLGNFGSIVIGGSLTRGASTITVLEADRGIGSLKIGGSLIQSQVFADTGAIGKILIGGDLVGDGDSPTITAFGQPTAPASGLDLAIKNLTVKGGVEGAQIAVGANNQIANADASIGAISVGRGWLTSTVLAGVAKGADDFFGTADDTKAAGTTSTRDAARFSTIASITIKGQALGSDRLNDTYGIVAEQILKAQIGAVKFAFTKGQRTPTDAFAAAPTGPGATGLASDFFIREITL